MLTFDTKKNRDHTGGGHSGLMVAKLDFLLRFFSLQTNRSSFSIVLFLGSPFLSAAYVCFGFLCFFFFLITGLGFYKTTKMVHRVGF